MINSFGESCEVRTLLYNTSRKSVYKEYRAYPVHEINTSIYYVYASKYNAYPTNMLLGVSEVVIDD